MGDFEHPTPLDAEARGALSLEYLGPAADSARRLRDRVARWRICLKSNPIWTEFVGPRWNHHKSAIWSDKSPAIVGPKKVTLPRIEVPGAIRASLCLCAGLNGEMSRCQWCRFCWRKIWRDVCLLMLIFFNPSITLGWCKKKHFSFWAPANPDLASPLRLAFRASAQLWALSAAASVNWRSCSGVEGRYWKASQLAYGGFLKWGSPKWMVYNGTSY